jgi:hypothetical protein
MDRLLLFDGVDGESWPISTPGTSNSLATHKMCRIRPHPTSTNPVNARSKSLIIMVRQTHSILFGHTHEEGMHHAQLQLANGKPQGSPVLHRLRPQSGPQRINMYAPVQTESCKTHRKYASCPFIGMLQAQWKVSLLNLTSKNSGATPSSR